MSEDEIQKVRTKLNKLSVLQGYSYLIDLLTSGDFISVKELREKIENLKPFNEPKCTVCGRVLSLGDSRDWVLACSPYDDDPRKKGSLVLRKGRTIADEHYSQSRMTFGSAHQAEVWALQMTIRNILSLLPKSQEKMEI